MGDFGGWDDDPLHSPLIERTTLPVVDSQLDITSYVSQQRTVHPSNPLRLAKPNTRSYGYRPPRLHELREERQRLRTLNPNAPHVDEHGIVHHGTGKRKQLPVVSDSWDTRPVAKYQGSKSKDVSVFNPPPPVARRNRVAAAAAPLPPKKGQSLFDDEADEDDHHLPEDYTTPNSKPKASAATFHVSNGGLAHCVVKDSTPSPSSDCSPTSLRATPHPVPMASSSPSPQEDADSPDSLNHLKLALHTTTEQLEGIQKQIADLISSRVNIQQEARSAQAEAQSFTAQIEKLRLSVRIEERNYQRLFQKHRTSSKLITEIAHKDKLIKEAEKMLRAVKARVDKLDLKPAAPESTGNAIPVRERMRDAVKIRSEIQKEVLRMKETRDVYQCEIDKLLAKFASHQRLLVQQSKADRAQLLKKSHAIEEKAALDLQEEMEKVKTLHAMRRQHRELVMEDELSELKLIDKKVHQHEANSKKNDEEESKAVNQLMINVKLLQIEEETLRKQVTDKRNYLFSLKAKETELATALSRVIQEVSTAAAEAAAISLDQADSNSTGAAAATSGNESLVRESKQLRASIEGMREKVAQVTKEISEENAASTAKSNGQAPVSQEELAATLKRKKSELRDIQLKRADSSKQFASDLEQLKESGLQMDRSIEAITFDVSDQKERYMIATSHNTNVLEKVDVVERLLAMYNL